MRVMSVWRDRSMVEVLVTGVLPFALTAGLEVQQMEVMDSTASLISSGNITASKVLGNSHSTLYAHEYNT